MIEACLYNIIQVHASLGKRGHWKLSVSTLFATVYWRLNIKHYVGKTFFKECVGWCLMRLLQNSMWAAFMSKLYSQCMLSLPRGRFSYYGVTAEVILTCRFVYSQITSKLSDWVILDTRLFRWTDHSWHLGYSSPLETTSLQINMYRLTTFTSLPSLKKQFDCTIASLIAVGKLFVA